MIKTKFFLITLCLFATVLTDIRAAVADVSPMEIDIVSLQPGEDIKEAYGVVFPSNVVRGLKGDISKETMVESRRPVKFKPLNGSRVQVIVQFTPEDLEYGGEYMTAVVLNTGRVVNFPARSIAAVDTRSVASSVSCISEPSVLDATAVKSLSEKDLEKFISERKLAIQTQRRILKRELTDQRAARLEMLERSVGLSADLGFKNKVSIDELLARISRLDALESSEH